MKNSVPSFFALLLSCALLTSCEKETQGLGDKAKIYVLSEITAGDSAVIPVGKSVRAGSGETIAFEKLAGAAVTLSDGVGSSIRLHWNNDADFLANPASIYTQQSRFQPNQTYSLQVSHQGLPAVSATTRIPADFSVQDVKVDNKELNGKEVLQFSFAITDAAAEKNYYLFEAVKQLVRTDEYFFWQGVRYNYNTPEGKQVYDQASSTQNIDIFKDTIPTSHYLRLNLYTGDLNTENEEFGGGLDSSFHRIFLTDSLFNGGTYATSFAVDKSYFEAKTPEQKGRVLVRVKSISRELYDYLSRYEKYRSEFGVVPPTNLSSPAGNIQNGLGVFGGSYKKEWIFYYDEL